MKKILSVFLAAVMVVACFVAFTVTSSAANGDWDVYSSRGDYLDESDPSNRSIPGYEYVDGEGLHMIPADYSDFIPYATIQSKKKVNLRDGVYMKVRIDNFTYDAGDKWFGFSIARLKTDEFISEDETGNPGVTAFARPNADKTLRTIQSDYRLDSVSGHKSVGNSVTAGCDEIDEQGRVIITLQVTWSEADGYNMFINGIQLDAGMMQELTPVFDEEDGLMYVGFIFQNSTKGGDLECTVLKFGTNEEDAETPIGDDSREPDNRSLDVAEIADPSKVEAGKPAIMLNGYGEASDVHVKMGASGVRTVLDDNSLNITATTALVQISGGVKLTVSYDIKDFPIAIAILRNLCTCTYSDLDYDGVPDEICQCKETAKVYALAGDVAAANESYTISSSLDMSEQYIDKNGNSYLYFIFDYNSLILSGFEGRINGIRMDINGIKYSDANRNNFDLYEILWFRDALEATNYFDELMAKLDGGTVPPETCEETTEENTETDQETDEGTDAGDATGADTGDDTTEPETDVPDATEPGTAEPETTEPETTEPETTEPETTEPEKTEPETTEPDATEPDTTDNETVSSEASTEAPEKKGGCRGTLGAGALAMAAFAAAGALSFRKKEDQA